MEVVFVVVGGDDDDNNNNNNNSHARWVPCHYGMARPQVADGGHGLQIWKVTANVLNKQSRTADKG
jgi:hypothetical protein